MAVVVVVVGCGGGMHNGVVTTVESVVAVAVLADVVIDQ